MHSRPVHIRTFHGRVACVRLPALPRLEGESEQVRSAGSGGMVCDLMAAEPGPRYAGGSRVAGAAGERGKALCRVVADWCAWQGGPHHPDDPVPACEGTQHL